MHAAWCWDEHFLDYFAGRGYRVLALDLRGHGSSPAGKPLRKCSIADYVADVRSVAADLPTRPVPIGHSMGGFIVQKYLEDDEAPACVLLASAPPRGLGHAALRGLRKHPLVTLRAAITRDPLHQISGARSREALYSPDTPDQLVAAYSARIQQESQKALAGDMIKGDFPRPDRVRAAVLALAGDFDGAITAKESEATATAYRTTAEFFPMGHNMMLEPGWRAVAERIDGWLVERGL